LDRPEKIKNISRALDISEKSVTVILRKFADNNTIRRYKKFDDLRVLYFSSLGLGTIENFVPINYTST